MPPSDPHAGQGFGIQALGRSGRESPAIVAGLSNLANRFPRGGVPLAEPAQLMAVLSQYTLTKLYVCFQHWTTPIASAAMLPPASCTPQCTYDPRPAGVTQAPPEEGGVSFLQLRGLRYRFYER